MDLNERSELKYLNQIVQGDCIALMEDMPDAFAHLIFADPPFNLGKNYKGGYNDSIPMKEYREWTFEWIDPCVRLLKEGGTLVVHHIPLHALWIGSYLLDTLDFQNLVAWKANTWPISTRLIGTNYSFLVFSKGRSKFIPWGDTTPHKRCRHCNGLLADWGGKESHRNPKGSRISDVWTDIERIRHKSKKTRKDANELPERITDRFILLYTDEGDVVFDPFMGSGTTGVSATRLRRNYIGFEVSEAYCMSARKRIEETQL